MAYLLARWMDPLLGVFTGVFAFYLHETHPRNGVAEDQRLRALYQWHREKNARLKE